MMRPGPFSPTLSILLLFPLSVAGCKFAELPPIEEDAAIDHSVGGTVDGLWTGADLILRLEPVGAPSQRLTVDREGTFAFPERLPSNTPFTLAIETEAAQHDCMVETPSGQVGDLDVDSLRVQCTSQIVVTVALSTLQPFTFDPQRTRQELAVSVLLGRVAATVGGPVGSTFLINGQRASALVPSAPIDLVLGQNVLAIDVTTGDLSRRYEIVLERGAIPPAEYFYSKASNRDANDTYGTAIAAYGDFIAIGAPGEDSMNFNDPSNNGAQESGAVYVTRRTGTELAYVKMTPPLTNVSFGHVIAMDDTFLVMGAPDPFGATPGSVMVLQRSGQTWPIGQTLTASNAASNDQFGYAVDIYGDTIAVGAPYEDDGDAMSNGAVYVFRRNGGQFVEEAILRGPNGSVFGSSLGLGADLLVVGAEGDASASTGISTTPSTDNGASRSGAVYVYRRSGTSWTLEAYIKASNAGADDTFGRTLDLDENVLVVGAPGEASAGNSQQENSLQLAGAAYVFRRSGTTWSQEAYLKAPSPLAEDLFGSSVSVRRDTIAVGARETFIRNDPGSVHLFNVSAGTWGAVARLTASNADPNDRFHVVTLSQTGLVVGAPLESGQQANDNNLAFSGAAYFFR